MTAPALSCAEIEIGGSIDLDPVTICACVTWLAMHWGDWKPECLAGEMARELLAAAGIAAVGPLAGLSTDDPLGDHQ